MPESPADAKEHAQLAATVTVTVLRRIAPIVTLVIAATASADAPPAGVTKTQRAAVVEVANQLEELANKVVRSGKDCKRAAAAIDASNTEELDELLDVVATLKLEDRKIADWMHELVDASVFAIRHSRVWQACFYNDGFAKAAEQHQILKHTRLADQAPGTPASRPRSISVADAKNITAAVSAYTTVMRKLEGVGASCAKATTVVRTSANGKTRKLAAAIDRLVNAEQRDVRLWSNARYTEGMAKAPHGKVWFACARHAAFMNAATAHPLLGPTAKLYDLRPGPRPKSVTKTAMTEVDRMIATIDKTTKRMVAAESCEDAARFARSYIKSRNLLTAYVVDDGLDMTAQRWLSTYASRAFEKGTHRLMDAAQACRGDEDFIAAIDMM
jgi:hypothetical protein